MNDRNSYELPEDLSATYDQIWDVRAKTEIYFEESDQGGDIGAYIYYMIEGGNLLLLGEEFDDGDTDRMTSLLGLISLIDEGVMPIAPSNEGASQTVASPFNTNLSQITFNNAMVIGNPGAGTFITYSDVLEGGSAIVWEASDMTNEDLEFTGKLIVVFDYDFMKSTASADEKQFVDNLLAQMSGGGTTETPSGNYYTVNLEVAAGIELHNLAAGAHQIQENGHLHLQFLPVDRTATAEHILFLVDGVEIEFNDFGEGSYYSYILNPITNDHEVLIAMKEYTVTLPEVEGVSVNIGSGDHQVAYGQSFTFSLTLDDSINPEDVKVFANGTEVKPTVTRATTLAYTIDKVIGPIVVTIEGAGEPTGNLNIAGSKIQITMDNGQLTIDNEGAASEQIQVYNVAGQLKAARVINGCEVIALQPGVYFVRTASKTYKVVVP